MDSGGSGGSQVPTAQENQRTIDKSNLSPEAYSAKYDMRRTLLAGTAYDQVNMGAITDVTGVGAPAKKNSSTLLGQ